MEKKMLESKNASIWWVSDCNGYSKHGSFYCMGIYYCAIYWTLDGCQIKTFAQLVSPMSTYLLPLLISFMVVN